MEPIFNQQGRVIGWINNDVILDISNQNRAFIRDKKVFSYAANYLGEFTNGYFWDKNGYAIAFVNGAHDGPLTPITEIPPIPALPPIPPISPIPPIPPIAPIHSLSWSNDSFEIFLS